MAEKVKIFVVDDDNLTIDLLQKPMEDSGFLNFVGRANSGERCLELLALGKKPVDLVIMDVNMPGIDGIETATRLIEKLKDSAPKIIFLTVFGDYDYTQKAFNLKSSILGKNIGIDYFLETIKRVMQGEIVINPNPNGIIKQDSNAKLKFVLKNLLKPAQIDIACLIHNGKTADEIATKLSSNTHHINNQKKEIYKRLKPLKDNINAASLGAIMERSGLCDPLEINNIDTLLGELRRR